MVKREAPLSFRVYITLLLSRPRQDGCIREDGLKVNELAATNDQAGRRLQLDLYAYTHCMCQDSVGRGVLHGMQLCEVV